MAVQGISTTYKGARLRSRLEARWAAFFDVLGWPWEYEPIDLAGYIPDFVVRFARPHLVEVKPEFDYGQLRRHVTRIQRSGWEGPALIVGTNPFESWSGACCVGLMFPCPPYRSFDFPAVLFYCPQCHRVSMRREHEMDPCVLQGCEPRDVRPLDGPRRDIGFNRAMTVWREAANLVQWRPPD